MSIFPFIAVTTLLWSAVLLLVLWNMSDGSFYFSFTGPFTRILWETYTVLYCSSHNQIGLPPPQPSLPRQSGGHKGGTGEYWRE